MTGNSFSIAPYEVAQYSKAAQTETLGEKNYEKADISDEEDEGEQGGKEMDTTDIASTGIFPSAKKSVEGARCPMSRFTADRGDEQPGKGKQGGSQDRQVCCTLKGPFAKIIIS